MVESRRRRKADSDYAGSKGRRLREMAGAAGRTGGLYAICLLTGSGLIKENVKRPRRLTSFT